MTRVLQGDSLDVLRGLPDEQFNCCVTSPPYWGLRDYGMPGQLGLEKTPEEYVARMVEVFREVRRVLRDDGTLWLNLGDSYSNDTKWGGASGGKNYTSAAGGYQGQRRHLKDCDPKRGAAAHDQPKGIASGLKPKDLVGIPWMVAFALRSDGWYLRSDIIWHKPNPMPEGVTDRPTKAHEYLFLLAKSERYFYNAEAIAEPCTADSFRGSSFTRGKIYAAKNDMRPVGAGARQEPESRNKRSVWTIPTQPYPEAHFATFPDDLVRPCILAGCPPGGTVLDPFAGSGTTLAVAKFLGCDGFGIELNPEYVKLAEKRLAQDVLLLECEGVCGI